MYAIRRETLLHVVAPEVEALEEEVAAPELENRLLSDGKKALYDIEKATCAFNVKFAVQKEPNGLAGAILCAEEYIGDEPFALLLGDEMIYAAPEEQSCMERLVDIFDKTGKSVIATMEVFGDDVSKYGNLGIESETDGIMTVNAIVEKPAINEALSNNAIIGRYVLAGGIMSKLKALKPKGNEIYLTDVLDELAKKGELLASTFEGRRYDVGDKLGFIKANVEYALRNEEIGKDFKAYIKEISKTL